VRLVVGLGNPGKEFTFSRHNIGFRVINRLARTNGISLKKRKFKSRWGIGEISGHTVILAKPQTFMNLSGEAVKRFQEEFELESHQLIVIQDDLDLDFGRIKIKNKGGNGGHKGIRSIIDMIGGDAFTRVKVGIGRPHLDKDATNYVLQPFDEKQKSLLNDVILKVQAAVELLLEAGIQAAMNRFNPIST
jgi:PTH1 family peptidyl-tRNA hydrolase